jgi:hypothetical protein
VYLAESFESSPSISSANHNSLSSTTHRLQIPEHVDRRLETQQLAEISGSAGRYHQSRSSAEDRASNHEFSTRSGELHSIDPTGNPLTTIAQPIFPRDEGYIRAVKVRPAHIYDSLHLTTIVDGADGVY